MITDIKINAENKKRWYEQGYWTTTTLCDLWNDAVRQYPDLEYVSDDLGVRLTYAEIDDKASRLAAWLKDVGVEEGDVVTFQCPPWAEFAIIYVAIAKAGAVIHPLAVTFNASDLDYIMNLVESKAFICPTFHHKTNFEDQINNVKDLVPSLADNAIAVHDKLQPSKGAITLNEIFEKYEPLTETPAAKSDDVLLILSTSGTTGRPKQVLYTHNTLIFAEHTFNKKLHLTHEDTMYMPAPLNHATGFNHGLISSLVRGARVVLQHEFRPSAGIDLINAEGVTWSMGATPFINDLLVHSEKENKPMPTLKLYVCGGAPVPGSIVEWAGRHGILLCEDYGSTESSPHIVVPPEKALEWDGNWSGEPYEGIEVKVVDANRNEVPYGVQGEEVSRGPNVFVGYLKNKEATDKDLDDDGWFYSGDLCFMDEQGRIKINGRKKEIIIRGGENVSCIEIDSNVKMSPAVEDCATVGMPDDRLGERIACFVVAATDPAPTKQEICDYLASQGIAKRLWPEHVEYIDKIPMTDTGKIQRNKLSKLLLERMEERAAQ